MIFTEQIKRLEAWKKALPEMSIDVAEEFQAEAVDLVTEEQLSKGKDGDGGDIKPDYTPFTVRVKIEKGQTANFVTLKDTGDYHGSIKFRRSRVFFLFYSDDAKAQKLENKYGKNLLSLNEESLHKFNDLIRSRICERAKQIL